MIDKENNMRIDRIEIHLIPGNEENEQPRTIIVARDRVENVRYPWEAILAAFLLENWIQKK